MARGQAVAGLEIGSFKTVAVIAERYRNQQIHVLGVGTAPSQGIFRGQVTDVEAAAASIGTAIRHAEQAAACRVERICVGIAGSHLTTMAGTAEILLRANERSFRNHHLQQLLVRLTGSVCQPGREVVYLNPLEYVVDGTARVDNPVGLVGRRLALTATIVTGLSGSLSNQAEAMRQARAPVYSAMLQPHAAAGACLDDEQTHAGVALLDIGHSTSDLMVFRQGTFRLMHSIPVAGESVTTDIAKGLHVPLAVAEELKLSHGDLVAGSSSTLRSTSFSLREVEFDAGFLREIIEARYEDLFLRARKVLVDAGLIHHLAAGIVLTGGGAQLPGVVRLAAQTLGKPGRRGVPPLLFGMNPSLRRPEFTTAVGLALAGIGPGDRKRPQVGVIADRSDSLESLRRWVRGLFQPNPGWSG